MKLTFPMACVIVLACSGISAQTSSARSIDDLIKEAGRQIARGNWNDLEGFETWKVERFLGRTRFFSNTDRYAFLTTDGRPFSIIVESGGRWSATDLEGAGSNFFLEVDGRRYPFLPKSAEEKNVFKVLRSTPNIPRLKKSRRYIHVQNLLDAFER